MHSFNLSYWTREREFANLRWLSETKPQNNQGWWYSPMIEQHLLSKPEGLGSTPTSTRNRWMIDQFDKGCLNYSLEISIQQPRRTLGMGRDKKDHGLKDTSICFFLPPIFIYLFFGSILLYRSSWLGTCFVDKSRLNLKATTLLLIHKCWD